MKKRINLFFILASLMMGLISLSGIRLLIIDFEWRLVIPTFAFGAISIIYATWVIEVRTKKEEPKAPIESNDDPINSLPPTKEAPEEQVIEVKELTPV